MFDWISNYASQADTTFKGVLIVFAGMVCFFLSAQAKFAMSRIIISILLMAVLVAGILNMKLFANRMESDIKASPAVVVSIDPHPAATKAAAEA